MKTKNLSLQSLKGLAALVVMVGHVLNAVNPNIYPLISTVKSGPLGLFLDGQCAVMVFFAITGFFYYKPMNYGREFINNYKGGGNSQAHPIVSKLLCLHYFGVDSLQFAAPLAMG
jgi:hypothetical protein